MRTRTAVRSARAIAVARHRPEVASEFAVLAMVATAAVVVFGAGWQFGGMLLQALGVSSF